MESIKDTGTSINIPNIKGTTRIFGCIAILIGAIYLGNKNYLMYHTAVELFSIVIAFTMTVIAISTYNINKDNRIIFLGIAYGFIACFDLIHTLAFKDMGVFAQDSSNIATQLWIAARYMESISLLIILKFPNKRFNLRRLSLAYFSISVLLLLSIFYWSIFPDCYLYDSDLTSFKIISEYIISVILVLGIFFLVKKNHSGSKKMNTLIFLSLVTTIISEMFFTYYISVYDLSNLMGHAFKLMSFYFIYIALVESSLKEPHLAQIELNKLLYEKNISLEDAMNKLRLEYKKRKELEELQKTMEIKEALLEKPKEMDELKTNFFCTVSHELKTPVNVILGSIQLLTSIHNNDSIYTPYNQSQKYIKMMRQNCNRLIKNINNLVDITKIDSGFMQMDFRNHNIVSVIEDITLSVVEYTERKSISLVFDTDIEEKIIACDAYRLERVMLNLLSNSVKFTEPEGSIWVNVRSKEESIVISVKDTGIGIPENMFEAVFDRFRQVDSSLRREKEGSGIGLSLVKSIVELHGGEVTLNSEVGKGSEFAIKLPMCMIDDSLEYSKVAVIRKPNIERIDIEFSDIYES